MARILAIIAAVRESVALINKLISLFEKWQDRSIDRHYDKKEKRRARLLKQIEMEKDDDKLRELHRRLRNLDS